MSLLTVKDQHSLLPLAFGLISTEALPTSWGPAEGAGPLRADLKQGVSGPVLDGVGEDSPCLFFLYSILPDV